MDKLARFYREMTDEQKGDLRRILIGGVIFILGEILSHTVPFFMGYGGLILFIPGWCVLGAEVLWSALKNIRHGQVFDENFLMCIASIGAFFTGDYGEAVAVIGPTRMRYAHTAAQTAYIAERVGEMLTRVQREE